MSYRCSLWISASPLLMLTGLVCAFLFAGCEEISGPSFVGSSDPKPGAQGPPPQPPTPADPAIAFVARAGGGPWDLRVMNADGSNVRTIYTATAGSQILPSWSPDGHSIAFINSWNLWRIDVTVVNGVPTGTNAAVLLDKTSSLSEPAWSPLGDEIAFVDINLKTLEVVPATGGVPEVLYSSPNTLAYPAWSPDATRIAFAESDPAGGRAVRVLTLGTGTVTTVLGAEFSAQTGAFLRFLDWARTQDVLVFDLGAPVSRIYTVPPSGGAPTFIVGGVYPTWSPNGGEILFTGLSAGQRLSKVALATGEVTSTRVSGQWSDWRRF